MTKTFSRNGGKAAGIDRRTFLCSAQAVSLALLACSTALSVPAYADAGTETSRTVPMPFDVRAHYDKTVYSVKMRDGVKLFTIVYAPRDKTRNFPFLLNRSPYSLAPYEADKYRTTLGPATEFEQAGYIFVYQNVRGRLMSEGTYLKPTPHIDHPTSSDHDESTDTYDTVEWLLKAIPHNNGRVGIWGVSQSGYVTSASIIDGHPAIRAASPQSPVTDYHDNDDYYHNGALMLETTNFFRNFVMQSGPSMPAADIVLPSAHADAYDEYLNGREPLSKSKALLSNPYFNEVIDHPSYDQFWASRDISRHMHHIQAAVLVVGAWFDAEDLNGPFKTFGAINALSPSTTTHLVIGPWVHFGWVHPGASVGDVQFGANTGEYFRKGIEFPFFEHYLKGTPDPNLAKATVFETGTNVWRTYSAWPPADATTHSLYLEPGGRLSFTPPDVASTAQPYDEYVSDPAHPVPELGYAHVPGPTQAYMDADQRFASRRSDVLVYQTEPLKEDVTFTGPVRAKLHVSTSGTDSDFVVKLIDVYPEDAKSSAENLQYHFSERPPTDVTAPPTLMGGYEQLIRGEPARGKYRRSLADPVAFTPNEPDEVDVPLVDVNHRFLKGHRIMIQIQSSWFPLVDLNPQTFVNIPDARPEDFKRATERVYHSPLLPSSIEFLSRPGS